VNSLPPEVLFAKHRLLPEIGPGGQRALLASTCDLPSAMGEITRDAAREYLARSGVTVTSSAPLAWVREDALEACVAELEGALFALTHVQRVVGVGAPVTIADTLREKRKTP
jgi:hypothetical protein